jgi:hypothetical protein
MPDFRYDNLVELTRHSLGMVIPVWFPPAIADGRVRENLLATLHDCGHYLPWEHVVLVVDGDARSAAIVRELQAAWGQRHGQAFDVVYGPENRGKGFAVCRGAEWFLQRRELQYLTVRDADGDHALNDLVNLMRLAATLRTQEGTEALIIIGRRNHPHRALGWLRGEFETLLNRVLVDAVRFAMAQRQEVFKTQYFSLSDEYPDIHSGYKVYSRKICELMVQRPWGRHPSVGAEIFRYGVEAVPFVEGAMAGAIIGEITRLTQEPEFSGHAAFARPETNGSVLLWTFLRLGITPQQAMVLLDNHISRLTLWTDPQGRESLVELRRYVAEGLARATGVVGAVSDLKARFYF